MTLVLTVALCGGCREQRASSPAAGPSGNEAPAPDQGAATPQKSTLQPAVTVNGVTIAVAEVEATAARLGVAYEEALKLSVQAEVVAREAAYSGFPEAQRITDRFALSRLYLETVYSAGTLCSNITTRHLQDFYEVNYQPDWPVDVYQGELVELRCCQRLDLADCDADVVAACLKANHSLLADLERLAARWGEGELPDLADLTKRYPGLVQTDFGMLDWPGIPAAARKPRTLLPEAAMDALRSTEAGGVAGPVASPVGYHLFKLTRKRPAIRADSPEFRAAAHESICRERIEKTRWDYVKRLVEAAVVERPDEGGRAPRQ